MKILFIPTNRLPFPPVNGGAVQNLIEFFVSWNEINGNHDITVYSILNSKAEKISKGYKKCTVKYINMNGIFSKFEKVFRHLINKLPGVYIGNLFINMIKKDLKKDINQYDVIILENCPEYAPILYNIAKGKIVCHLHNDWLSKKTKLANKKINSIDEVWAISNYINKKVSEISKEKDILTLYNGIDEKKFEKNIFYDKRNELREKFGIDNDEIVILFTGRVVPQKGVKELVQAFVNLPDDINAKLLIVGSKIYGETVEDNYLKEVKDIAKLKKSKIVFTGYMEYSKIGEVCSISDIGVLPTIWEEPLSLTVIEYMTASLPVIITNSGGMIELIDDKSAIVIDKKKDIIKELEHALKLLIIDKNKRIEMGEYARERAILFSKENYCINLNNSLRNFKNKN